MAGYIGNNPSESSVRIARQIYTTSGITSDFTFTSGYDAGYIDIYVNGERQTEGTNFTASDGSTFTILNGGVSTGSTVEAAAYKSFNVATVTLGEVTDVDDLTISGALNAGSTVVGSAVTSNLSGINVSGAVTATSFSGDGSGLTGVASTDNITTSTPAEFQQINVSGIATVGVATISTSIVVGSAVTVTATAININPTVTTTIGDSGNVDFNDDAKARFGTGNDLSIYHSGSHSFINDSGTGNLKILSSQVDILNPASSETIATFAENGAVSLYYDNSKKFETFSAGFRLVNNSAFTMNSDSSSIYFGADDDMQIAHDGTKGYLKNKTGDFYLYATNTDTGIKVVADGSVEIYNDNSKKFETFDGGTLTTGIGSFSTQININTNGSSIAENNLNFACSGIAYIDHRTTGKDITFRMSNSSALDTNAIIIGAAGITTFSDTPHDDKGDLRSIPQNVQTSAYVITASDAGKHIRTDSNVTLNNSTLSVGDAVTIVNYGSSDITITQGSGVSLHLAGNGTGNQGDRTLVATGMCTILYVGSSQYFASGAGLS